MELAFVGRFIAWLGHLKATYPVAFVVMVFIVVAPFINILISLLTSKKWHEIQAKNPRLAAALKLLKAAGLDPVGVLKWLYTILTGRPWTDPMKSDGPPDTISKP